MAALHGLTRALAANAVQGVSTGFTRELDIVGTGYRADVKGKSRPSRSAIRTRSKFYLPEGVDMKIDKQTHLVLSGLRPAVGGAGCGAIFGRSVRPIRTRTRASVIPAKPLRKKAGKTGGGRQVIWHEIREVISGSYS